MHIRIVELSTKNLASQEQFFESTLGFSLLASDEDSFTVKAGETRLTFHESPEGWRYHVAFAIPKNLFSSAKGWLSSRVALMRRSSGEDEVDFPQINARSFYFGDPDGNILEFIVHRGLEEEANAPFGPESVLRVCEIGLPVEDVSAFASALTEQLGIQPYPIVSTISDQFAFMGDIFGQLVVVKAGRAWLPTDDVFAETAPVRLAVAGSGDRQMHFERYPYAISMTADESSRLPSR